MHQIVSVVRVAAPLIVYFADIGSDKNRSVIVGAKMLFLSDHSSKREATKAVIQVDHHELRNVRSTR